MFYWKTNRGQSNEIDHKKSKYSEADTFVQTVLKKQEYSNDTKCYQQSQNEPS